MLDDRLGQSKDDARPVSFGRLAEPLHFQALDAGVISPRLTPTGLSRGRWSEVVRSPENITYIIAPSAAGTGESFSLSK
jgi:hypothetical protein